MKNEIYLRHSQRQYSRSPHRPNREMSELSSTFSTGTLNTQLSVDSTLAAGDKDNNPPNTHAALQDTLSGGSVVSYPANFLATSNASTAPIFANIRATQDLIVEDTLVDAPIEDIESKKSSPLSQPKNQENTRRERDSGLGEDSPHIEHITLKFGDVTQGMDHKVEVNSLSENSHTESESNTPTSSAGMLDDEDSHL